MLFKWSQFLTACEETTQNSMFKCFFFSCELHFYTLREKTSNKKFFFFPTHAVKIWDHLNKN